MVTLNRYTQAGHGLRASMSIAAALSVLGFTSLVWLHNSPPPIVANSHAAAAVADAGKSAAVAPRGMSAPNGVPSADSVFRGSGYIAPEEPVAQF